MLVKQRMSCSNISLVNLQPVRNSSLVETVVLREEGERGVEPLLGYLGLGEEVGFVVVVEVAWLGDDGEELSLEDFEGESPSDLLVDVVTGGDKLTH